MSLLSFARPLAARAVLLVAVLGGARAATAADETPPPRVIAGPAAMPGPGCPTCEGGAPAAGGGKACGRLGCGPGLFARHKAPYVVQLCPGACFGYFQTQWHRWEDVCPLPYQGIGLSDAPRPSPGYIPPGSPPGMLPEPKPGKGSDAPLPRPVGPMPGLPNLPGKTN
jgi:hypothetical protein